MAAEWKTAYLGEIVRFQAGSVFAPQHQGQSEGDYPFVKVSDMNSPANGISICEAKNWVSAGVANQIKAKPLPAGTVVFAKIGEALRQNRLRRIIRPTIVDNNMMGAVPTGQGIDSDFLYYAMSRYDFSSIAQGTALPYLTVSALSRQTLSLPCFSEQRAIAHILGTLDDKIELDRRTSQTLEAMARALFKLWFVDFDPVVKKSRGEWRKGESLPGLPAHLYDLFPDRLVESEFGEIPEGWKWATVDELVEFNPSESLRRGIVAPYLDMAALPTSGSWPDAPIDREFGSGMKFRNDDTLFARITPCLENGKTAFIQLLPDEVVGWGSTEFIVMRARGAVPSSYTYLLARSAAFREHAIRSMTGTSGRQRAQAEAIKSYRVASPNSDTVWRSFGDFVNPVFVQIREVSTESELLARLRDVLLPKLVSGELRVKDAERFVGKVA